jgi:glycosyltransferase involved in cell wall biosynthesis
MIKVLFPFVGGPLIGGSHVSALTLAASLDRNHFAPQILLHREGGALGDYVKRLGLDYEVLADVPILTPRYSRVDGDASAVTYLRRTFWSLRRILHRMAPDIVHTNDGRMHMNWALPTKSSGRKLVWHHREGPNAFGVNKLAPLVADRIICVSHFSMPAHPVRSIDKRFRMVRSPFEFPETRPDRQASHARLCHELGVGDDAVLLGYFGVLNDRKRPLHFVQVIKELQDGLPDRDIQGLIFGKVETAGTQHDERCLSLARELGIAGKIHLMGFRSPIHDEMAGVDALLVPALNEPFGRTLIEAMYIGTPVVATRHGGNIEAIADGETGFLVDWERPAAFVAPIRALLENPSLRARIISAAQDDAVKNYGLRRHVDCIEAEYRALMRGKNGDAG